MYYNYDNSLLPVCNLLEKFQVQYLLVVDEKADVDIWFNPTYENYYKVLEVIEALGCDASSFRNEKAPNPRKSFFKLEFDAYKLDILPEIKIPARFSEIYKRRETIELGGIKIHYLGYKDLIDDKSISSRKKDLDDIEHLKQIRGEDD